MKLNRADILNKTDLPKEEVFVPEWGGSVFVRALTAKERVIYEQAVITRTGKDVETNLEKAIALLVALTVVDEDGKRLFSNKDADELADKNANALSKLYMVAVRMSSLAPEDVKELAENLKNAVKDGSNTL